LGKIAPTGTGGGGTSNGAVLIGGTGGPAWGTLAAGIGISITNNSHSITIKNTLAGRASFLAEHQANVPNVTGDDSDYWLGSNLTLVSRYDTTGSLSLGTGTAGASTKAKAAFFTTPSTGLYYFQFLCCITGLTRPPTPPPPPPIQPNFNSPITIFADGVVKRSVSLINAPFAYQLNSTQSYFIDGTFSLTAGDPVYFLASVLFEPNAPTPGPKNLGVGTYFNTSTGVLEYTYISGWQIA